MNNQETYNKVKAHLLAQGEPSRQGADCLYRGANGLKCAIGCLIADDQYDPAFEGQSPEHNQVITAVRASGCQADVDLLSKLQEAHDKAWSKGDFLADVEDALTQIAIDFELTP